MAKILIVAEHDGSALNPSTAKCVSCAAAIDGAEIDVLVLARHRPTLLRRQREIARLAA